MYGDTCTVLFDSVEVEDNIFHCTAGAFAEPAGNKECGAGAEVINLHSRHHTGVGGGVYVVEETGLFSFCIVEQTVVQVRAFAEVGINFGLLSRACCFMIRNAIGVCGKDIHVIVVALVVTEAVVRCLPGARPLVVVNAPIQINRFGVIVVTDKGAIFVEVNLGTGFAEFKAVLAGDIRVEGVFVTVLGERGFRHEYGRFRVHESDFILGDGQIFVSASDFYGILVFIAGEKAYFICAGACVVCRTHKESVEPFSKFAKLVSLVVHIVISVTTAAGVSLVEVENLVVDLRTIGFCNLDIRMIYAFCVAVVVKVEHVH